MANENDVNVNINTTADSTQVEKLGSKLSQVGEIAEKSAKKANEAQKEQSGIIAKTTERIKELNKALESADSEQEIEKINREIKELERNLKRLNELGDDDLASKRQLKELEEQSKKTSKEFGNFGDQLGSLPGPAGEVAGSIQSITAAANPATVIVAALAAAIIATFTASKDSAFGLAENAKEIENLKNVTGVATLTAVTFAQAIKAQGGDVADITDIFNQLAGVISEVKAGNKDLEDALKGFGIEDFSNLDKVVIQLANNLATLPKDINTVANASKILGEEGVRQFSAVAPEIGKYSKLVEELGLANEETLKKGRDLNTALADSVLAFEALQNTIGGQTAPAFTEITKSVKDFILELAKSETAKKFFKDFSEGLLEVVKLAVSTKNALKDLLDIIDPLVQKFTGFNNTLELISKNSLPGTIAEISRLINTYVLGDRALEQQIKKQKEYEEQLKQTSATTVAGVKQQQDALAALQNQVENLTKASEQALASEKIISEQKIQNLQELALIGKATETEALIEIAQIKEDLANKEVDLARQTRDSIAELARQNIALQEELAKAELDLNQAVLAANAQRIESIKQLQAIAAKETREQIDQNRKDRQDAASEELAEIKSLEDRKVILREEAAKRKREIAIRELQQQMADEQSIIDNAGVGEAAREEARKNLSELIRKQGELDRQTEKAVQDAIVKDTQDAANQRIAEEKRISDEARKEADRRIALTDQQKAINRVAFDQKIAQLKASGATAEQIALATADFEVQQQLRVVEAIKAKIEAQKGADSPEAIKLATQLIEAEGKLNQLQNGRIEITKKQNQATSDFNQQAISGNEAFNKSLQESAERVKKIGDAANSSNANLQAMANFFTSIAKQFEFAFDENNLEAANERLGELKEQLAEINQEALLKGFPPALALAQALAEDAISDLTNKISTATQKASVEAAQKAAAEQKRLAREAAQKALELEQKKNEQLAQAAEDRRDQIQDINQEIADTQAEFDQRELDRTNKLAEDKAKAEENFRKREEELAKEAEEREIERQERLLAIKQNAALTAADRLNQIQRDSLTKQAQLQAQIDAESDPEKKKALQNQLGELTKESNAKEEREKRKQAEIEKLLSENLSEEELKARQEAIERRFDLEEEADEQRQELIKSGNKKALEEFDRLVAEQKKRDEERLAQELARIREQAKRKEDQAKQEREQRQNELDQRLKDLQDNYDKEKTEDAKRHQERITTLEAQQKEIRDRYKETVAKIVEDNTKAQEELAKAAGLAGEAFANSFDQGLIKGGKFGELLDSILKKLGAINNQTGDDGTSSSSPSNPSSSPNNNNSGNVFSSPTQGNNNGSAGNLGNFRQQAPNSNQNNQGNQGNQQGNSLSSPPASPSSNSQSSQPSNNQSNPSSNPPISSTNQVNQNSSSKKEEKPSASATASKNQNESSKKSANVPSIGEMKTAKDYRKVMIKIRDEYYKSVGIELDKLYTQQEIGDKLFKDKKVESSLVDAQFEATGKYINYIIATVKDPEILKMLQRKTFGVIPFVSSIITVKGVGKVLTGNAQKVGDKFTIKGSDKRYAKILDERIAFYEQYRGPDPEPANPDEGGGGKDAPTKDGDAESNPEGGGTPNQPGGGRGNNPSPRSPGSTNPVKPNIPNSGGLSDKEKAFFANRDKDADTGFDESVASGLAGRRGLRPDAAVGGNANNTNNDTGNTDNPGANQAGQSQNQSQNPFGSNEDPNDTSNVGFDGAGEDQGQSQTINQTNNSSTINNYYLSGILTDKKTMDEIMSLMQKTQEQAQQEAQQKLRNLAGPRLLR